MRRSLRTIATTAVVAVTSTLLVACVTATSSASSPASSASTTVWLCHPGTGSDPCAVSLAATVVPATGARHVVIPATPAATRFDCFYVYPTVSTQSTDNSNLVVSTEETNVARSQAAPFSQVCRVWAPMYRQRTVTSLFKGLGGDPAADAVAFKSLLSGWTDYLAHFNDGRPIVFIGHSQGAAMLIRLLEKEVDPNRLLRAKMVAAIILGGNVAVPLGKVVGATFAHLPLCVSASRAGCVIAYSSFPSEPPTDSLFGRPGQGVSLQSGQTATKGVQVACVNPAAIGGATGALQPWFRTRTSPPPAPRVATPWVTYPDLYSASCRSAGGATWLQVADVAAPGDDRPVVTESLGPQWGYHLDDVNLATGNLVDDVRSEERAYTAAHR